MAPAVIMYNYFILHSIYLLAIFLMSLLRRHTIRPAIHSSGVVSTSIHAKKNVYAKPRASCDKIFPRQSSRQWQSTGEQNAVGAPDGAILID